MKIHVVRPGQSVWSIARQYGVNPNRVIEVNGIQDLPHLVVGEALVIPDDKPKNYGYIEVNAFIQPSTPEKETRLINEAGAYLTYIAPFSYHVNANATLTPIEDQTVISTARNYRVAPLMSVTNLSGANFNTELINAIMTSPQLQQTLINNIRDTLRAKGYYGVLVDFERIAPENRQRYNDFLRRLVTELHQQNYLVGTALAPKTYDVKAGAWHGAHDYRAHGEILDFVVIMTYEWGWSGGPPMAVAPINEVRKVINYAVSVIPPKKIMMGIPFYGYDWSLPYTPGGEFAKSIGHQEAVEIAARYGAAIRYDEKAQSPYFNYRDEEGIEHVVWFEDARSVMAKYRLVNQYGLRGVSYWVLAKPFRQNWEVLDSMFNIVKVIPQS